MHAEAEINDILRHHFSQMEEERSLYLNMREAAANRLWGTSGATGSPISFWMAGGQASVGSVSKLPIKRQVNTLRPFINRTKAMLYKRAPRVTVTRPKVRGGRRTKLSQEDGDALSEVLTELARRPSTRDVMEMAIEESSMMPGCAIKFGMRTEKGSNAADPFSRFYMRVVPYWNAGWDDHARCQEEERYRFEVRYVRLADARELCPAIKDDEKGTPIIDWLEYGTTSATEDQGKSSGYVRILEWWDLVDNQYQHFLLSTDNMVDCCGSEPKDIPYKWPDGTPMVQLIPVLMESEVSLPYKGTSIAKASFDETCEMSLVLSIVLSAFRRDASRTMLYLASKGVSKQTIDRIVEGYDLEFVEVDGNVGDLSELFQALNLPSLSQTLDKASAYISGAARSSSSQSALSLGRTEGLEYAPATTAQAIQQGDAAAASAPADRMAQILAQMMAAALVMVGSKSIGIHVDMGDDEYHVPPEKLRLPWVVKVEDASAEAQKRESMKTALVQVSPILMATVTQATGVVPEGQPPIPPQVQTAAQRLLDVYVETFQLPERLLWSSLNSAKQETPPPPVTPPPPPMPEMPMPEVPMEEPLPEPLPEELPPEPEPVDPRVALLAQMTPEELEELTRMLAEET